MKPIELTVSAFGPYSDKMTLSMEDFSGLFLIYAALCFFTLEGLEFMNMFTVNIQMRQGKLLG